jgi:hypothetical protein
MFQKIPFLVLALFGLAGVSLHAQNMVIETTNGTTVTENLVSVENLAFPNHNLIIDESGTATRAFSLTQLKKIIFSPLSATGAPTNATAVLVLRPNPAGDFIRIENAPAQETRIAVYSAQGAKMLESTISASGNTLHVESLQAGFYVVKMNDQTSKFIKI